MSKALPARPDLEYLKKLAKQRLKLLRVTDSTSRLAKAQLAVARDYGFASWRKLQAHVKAVTAGLPPPNDAIESLRDAIVRGDASSVRQLLGQHPSIISAPQSDGRTPLHTAAEHNNAELVELLVARGANLTASFGHSAHTPLSWAITVRSAGAVEALIRLGAPVDLYIAAGLGLVDRVKSFFDHRGRLKANPSTNGSSRFASDGTRLPRPPTTEREIISDAVYNAARSGQVAVVEFLLTRNPDLTFRAYIGGTPLHWAYYSGSTEVVRLLLDAGADPRLRDDKFNCTPRAFGICVCASWGIADLVRQQLKNDPRLVNIFEGRGTPLHEAARAGSTEIVTLLLNAGANPSLRDADGKTALDLAIEHDHPESAEILKRAAAAAADPADMFLDLALPTPDSDHRAGSLGPAADLLKKHPELRGASIFTACVTGSLADLKQLLEHDKLLANTPGGPRSWPPLCYLTFSRFLRDDTSGGAEFVRCAKCLLDAGADPNSSFLVQNDPNHRETALHGAAGIANNAPLTRLLIDAGADPADHESLYHASEFAGNAALRVLLTAKMDRKWISYCMCHKMDMEDPAGLSLFIEAGADVNFLIDRGQMIGWRPLHFALSRGRSPKVIQLLLQAGADPNLPAADGMTAYRLARRLGHADSAKLMLDHGAREDQSETEDFLAALTAADRPAVRRMIAANPSLPASLKPEDHKLLVDAAAAGNVAAVRLMLDHGFQIDTKGRAGGGWDATALHYAAWHGHTAVVRLLLNCGADPLMKHGYDGNSLGAAIHGASQAGHRHGVEVVKLIAAALTDAEVRKHLEYAKTHPDAAVVKAMEQIIRDRESEGKQTR